ncbi:MAG: hypothetical protein LIP03_01805 [Bacteroidales bacterium]|nr:hypothetical protein [Bacteroidales bacterium]
MKKLFLVLFALIGMMAQGQNQITTAYAIRFYSPSTEEQALVKFSVTDPGSITEVMALPNGMYTRGAACYQGKYYIIQSDDGMVPYSLWTLDITTKQATKIADYSTRDRESALIIMDMTCDPSTGALYCWAFDLDGDPDFSDDEEVDIPFGLFLIDTATGAATLIGYEEDAQVVGSAINEAGEMVAMDALGNLWQVDIFSGQMDKLIGRVATTSSLLQSMAYDYNTGYLYWAGVVESNVDLAPDDPFLGRIEVKKSSLTYDYIGAFEDHQELIGLYIDPETVSAYAPQAPTDVAVTPGAEGAQTATITWQNPGKTMNNLTLSGAVTANIYRDGQLIAETKGGSYEYKEYTDTEVPDGLHLYSVRCANDYGEGYATYAEETYIGSDVPAAPGNIQAEKELDVYDVYLSWEAPTVGLHNGWFDTESLCYNVVRHPNEVVIATDLKETSLVDKSITELAGYSYTVTAINSKGEGGAATSDILVSGPALELPYYCDFSTETEANLWTVNDWDGDGQTWTRDCFTSIDQWYMRYVPDYEIDPAKSADDELISPPFQVEMGKKYMVKYQLRLYGTMFPYSYSIAYKIGEMTDDLPQVIEQYTDVVDTSLQFVEHYVKFVATGTGACKVYFTTLNLSMANITNVSIEEVTDYDLSATNLACDPVGMVGVAMPTEVTVTNYGDKDISTFSVELREAESNVLLASQTFSQSIPTQQSATVTVDLTPTAEGDLAFYATAVMEGDQNNENDASPIVEISVLPAGEWIDVGSGTTEQIIVPFHLYRPYSTTQTLYTAKSLGDKTGEIAGIKFYYTVYANRAVDDFYARIYLSETTESQLSENPIDLEQMTCVFEGLVTVDSYASVMAFMFDERYQWQGGNLLVVCQQENPGGSTNLRWLGTYTSGGPQYTAYSSGSTPYDGGTFTTMSDLPNASFYLPDTGGIADLEMEGIKVGASSITGTWSRAQLYSLSGIALRSSNDAIDISGLPAGLYILRFTTADGRTLTAKLPIN